MVHAKVRRTGGKDYVSKKTLFDFDLVIPCITHTPIVEITRRNAYDAAFKVKGNLAAKEGKTATARSLGVNESMA